MASIDNRAVRELLTTTQVRGSVQGSKSLHAIHLWSAIGGLWSLIILYTFSAWLLSDKVHTTLTGSTPVPESMRFNAIFWQAFLGAISLGLFYVFVIKGWRREGRLTLFGMLYIASQTMWWQDSLLNLVSPVFTYNSVLVNWGSWNAFVPGWLSPNAEKMPSPVLLYLGLYPVFFCGAVILIVSLIQKAKVRWPQTSDLRIVSIMYVLLGLFGVVAESLWLRCGLYTYTGVWSPVTLWADQPYKVPVTQLFFLDSAVLTCLASLMYFRDDKGLTMVERGVDQLVVGRGKSSVLRLLAMIGAANTILFVCYNIPMNYLAIRGTGWAPSVLEKSYFTNGVCGNGSTYACPGGAIPIPIGPKAMHVSPAGTLVNPDGSPVTKPLVGSTE